MRRILLATITAVALTAPTYKASAGEATWCRPSDPTSPHGIDNYGIHNKSSSADLDVYCPVVGTQINQIYMYGWPRNPNTPISCTLYSTDNYGNITGWQALNSLNHPNPGNPQPDSAAVSSVSYPYFSAKYMRCTIPRAYWNGSAWCYTYFSNWAG